MNKIFLFFTMLVGFSLSMIDCTYCLAQPISAVPIPSLMQDIHIRQSLECREDTFSAHDYRPNTAGVPFKMGFCSGTNLRIGTHVVWPNGPGNDSITKLQISIVGTIDGIKTQPEVIISHDFILYGPSNAQYWKQLSTIDTTHFDNNTTIEIINQVWSKAGAYAKDLYDYHVMNNAYILANPTFDGDMNALIRGLPQNPASSSLITVRDAFRGIRYTPRATMAHLKNTIVPLLPKYQAFYVDTHGSPTEFGDCTATDSSDESSTMIDYTEMGSSVFNKNGTIPPYNWVFIDACLSFSAPAVASAMLMGRSTHPVGFPLPPPNSDRAAMGWQHYSESAPGYLFLADLMGELGQGVDLKTAISKASGLDAAYEGNVASGPWYPSSPKVYGDLFMTLHNVYHIGTYKKPPLGTDPNGYLNSQYYDDTYDGAEPSPNC